MIWHKKLNDINLTDKLNSKFFLHDCTTSKAI